MYSSRFTSFIAICVTLLSTVACVEILPEKPLDPKDADIVVKCVLTPAFEQKVELMYSVKGSDGKMIPVQDAKVILSKTNGEMLSKPFVKQQDGLWTLTYSPEYNMGYKLSVIVPGRDTVWAETKTYPEISVLFADEWCPSDTVKQMNSLSGELLAAGFTGYVYDYMCGALFYVLELVEGAHPVRASDCNIWIVSDSNAKLGTNHLYADDFNTSGSLKFDCSYLYDSESYQYSQYRYMDGYHLHSGLIRIHHIGNENINGVPQYTFFGVSNMEWSATPDAVEEQHKISSSLFSVVGDFAYPTWEKWHHFQWPELMPEQMPSKIQPKGKLLFYFVSDELDEYYKNVEQYLFRTRTDLLDLLYSDENSISTNVNNGYGIFGAVQCLYFDCESDEQREKYDKLIFKDIRFAGELDNYFDL